MTLYKYFSSKKDLKKSLLGLGLAITSFLEHSRLSKTEISVKLLLFSLRFPILKIAIIFHRLPLTSR